MTIWMWLTATPTTSRAGFRSATALPRMKPGSSCAISNAAFDRRRGAEGQASASRRQTEASFSLGASSRFHGGTASGRVHLPVPWPAARARLRRARVTPGGNKDATARGFTTRPDCQQRKAQQGAHHALLRHRFSDHRTDRRVLRLFRRRRSRGGNRQDPVCDLHHSVHCFPDLRTPPLTRRCRSDHCSTLHISLESNGMDATQLLTKDHQKVRKLL